MTTADKSARNIEVYGYRSAVGGGEERAFTKIASELRDFSRSGYWRIYFNLEILPNYGQGAPKNIDVVIISDAGVWVAELKSLSRKTILTNKNLLIDAIASANSGARIISNIIKSALGEKNNLGWITGDLVLEDLAELARGELSADSETVNRVRLQNLDDFVSALTSAPPGLLTLAQVAALCDKIAPYARVKMGDKPRWFRNYQNLEIAEPNGDTFHRIFRGRDARTSERVELHVYDIGWNRGNFSDPWAIAERECKVLVQLQKLPSIPRILSTFAEDSENPGELAFMVIEDPSSNRSLEKANTYQNWGLDERIRFAARAFEELDQIHSRHTNNPDIPSTPILHRNLSPAAVRASSSDGQPIFTRFHLASVDPNRSVVAGSGLGLDGRARDYAAPEVVNYGLSAADTLSDSYSLSKILRRLFTSYVDEALAERALSILETGCSDSPDNRHSAKDMAEGLNSLLQSNSNLPEGQNPPYLDPELWDETTQIHLPGKPNQIWQVVARVGAGAEYMSFRVRRLLAEDSVGHNDALIKVPIHTDQRPTHETAFGIAQTLNIPHIQRVLEIANTLSLRQPGILLDWVPGFTLEEAPELITELAAEAGMPLNELLKTWLHQLLMALSDLHSREYCLCDISPRNIIVDGSKATWIDLAGIARYPVRQPIVTPKYVPQRDPSVTDWSPEDDLCALALCFQELLRRIPPIEQLDPQTVEGASLPESDITLAGDFALRDALGVLGAKSSLGYSERIERAVTLLQPSALALHKLRDPHNGHLKDLLSVYPGSRFGNAEARGLDTEFSRATYVPSELDKWVVDQVRSEQKSLVLLFGNAGDGKTAFLQYLISQLFESTPPPSSERIFQATLPSGRQILINFDGSASFNGKSATTMLDDLLLPFIHGITEQSPVHLVAVNSGPLLDWIDSTKSGLTEDHLPRLVLQLESALGGQHSALDPHVALIDLNRRSLVGGSLNGKSNTSFLEDLIDSMIDPSAGDSDPWRVCQDCSAQDRCVAINTVRLLRRERQQDQQVVLARIARALQAVHLTEKVHITARELKGALSFLLFGTYECEELQSNQALKPRLLADRLFANQEELEERRQGQVLNELRRFDPGWTAKPLADRLQPASINLRSYRRERYLFQSPSEPLSRRYDLQGAEELNAFLEVTSGSLADRTSLLNRILGGLSRIDELPAVAYRNPGYIPFRLDTQTATEMAFWVERPISEFDLVEDHIESTAPVVDLPTRVYLTHRSPQGSENRLSISLELFTVLSQLHQRIHFPPDGISGGLLSNLRVFLGRILERDEPVLYCHDPQVGQGAFAIRSRFEDGRTVLSTEKLE